MTAARADLELGGTAVRRVTRRAAAARAETSLWARLGDTGQVRRLERRRAGSRDRRHRDFEMHIRALSTAWTMEILLSHDNDQRGLPLGGRACVGGVILEAGEMGSVAVVAGVVTAVVGAPAFLFLLRTRRA